MPPTGGVPRNDFSRNPTTNDHPGTGHDGAVLPARTYPMIRPRLLFTGLVLVGYVALALGLVTRFVAWPLGGQAARPLRCPARLGRLQPAGLRAGNPVLRDR